MKLVTESHEQRKHREYRNLRLKRLKARWPAWVALFVAAMLYEALPKVFYWGPRGLMISLVTVLIISLIVTSWRSNLRINRMVSLIINVLITFYMIMSVSRLVFAVLQGHIGPAHLLASSLTLWATNVLVFALWYWTLDAGGPNRRELDEDDRIVAFLFPQTQITLTQSRNIPHWIKNWEPTFIDYLFLAFNTSTAFSPTDTPVLSRWAKCLCMIQALLSLMIIVMLAARAINILSPTANYLVS
jgi:hypothetical protein